MSRLISKSKKRKMFHGLHETQSEKIVHTYSINITPEKVISEASQYMTNMEDSIAAVEALLMYNFKNKSLLEAALTHSSYTESQSYQRLEFVGDSALGQAITNFFYLTYPDLGPGQLSRLRAANISNEKLARVAVHSELYKYVRHKANVLNDKVREFVIAVEEEDEMVVHGGHMKAPKVLADIVESVAGAVYEDCGLNLEWLWVVIRELLEPMVMLNVLEKQPQPITMLFETCQKEGKTVDIKHRRKGERSIARVYVDRRFIASGSSENKENAKLHAAEVALSKLTRLKSTDALSLHMNGDCNETTEIKDAKRKMFPDLRKTQLEKIVHTYNIDIARGDLVSEASGRCMTNMENSIAAVEAILMYNFKNKILLEEALTHSSYTESQSYERLEWLGDSTLGFAISNLVYLTYPDVDPGQLSLLRAANINTEKLARVAVQNGLYKYVHHKTTVLNDKVREFVIAVKEEDEMVVHGGQMKAPKVLADIVESVVGAVYEDCGFNLQTLLLVIRELLEPMVMLNVLEKQPQPITMLFEACQKEGKTVDIKHQRKGERNIASVYVDRRFIASGSSESKENAKLHAAEAALSKLTRLKSTDALSLHMNDDCKEATEIKGAKQRIHELCNKKKWPNVTYRVEQESGPAHDRRYIASVQIKLSDKIFFMKGEERSKVKDAENSAASDMFYSLRELGY